MIKRLIQVFWAYFTFPYLVVKNNEALKIQSDQISKLQYNLGKIQAKLNQIQPPENINGFEFQAFSQWGEDGIIQYILDRLALPLTRQKFIEFGVQDFLESNCRFLMLKENWSGLIIDGSSKHIRKIRSNFEFWKYDLNAICRFITKENINQILRENGYKGDIGILSIDIDGNDYWVWEAITEVNPAVVIIEYNTHFGPERDLSVPYDPKFDRLKKHHSGNYWGASITAMTRLGKKKGYQLLGSNSTGVNLFFIQDQFADRFKIQTVRESFVWGKFRENRDTSGRLLFGDFDARIQGIAGLPLWDFEKNQEIKF